MTHSISNLILSLCGIRILVDKSSEELLSISTDNFEVSFLG